MTPNGTMSRTRIAGSLCVSMTARSTQRWSAANLAGSGAPASAEELGSPEDEDEGADDIHRTIVGCLLARVPGPEITLNAAAKLLAWSGDERFAKYRQTNPKGHQRVNESLRRAILTACRRNICIVSDGQSRGFACNEHNSPVTLRRFDHPASAVDLASQATEFEEDA